MRSTTEAAATAARARWAITAVFGCNGLMIAGLVSRTPSRGSAARLLRLGTLVAAGGLAVVVLSPWAALGVAGFAVLGIGLATPLPVLFGVVGHLGGEGGGAEGPGSAVMVARFGTMTFTGLLLSPAIIGWAAEMVGLTWTLAALIPLLLGVAAAAGVAARPEARPAGPVPSIPGPASARAT